MPQEFDPLPFHVDHIIAQKHEGATELDNLALACFHCNLYKGPNIAGLDPNTGAQTKLFHPRLDRWTEHFRWQGPRLLGTTPAGRATVAVLRVNLAQRLAHRASLAEEGVFPP